MHAPQHALVRAWACALAAGLAIALAADPPRSAAAGANAFAFDLYARLSSAEGNLFVSPFSVRTALAMTYAGAGGETAAQMRRVLRLDDGHDAAGSGSLVGPEGGGSFGVANRLWGERTYAFLPDFVARIGDLYDGGLEQVDFVGNAEGARARMVPYYAGDGLRAIELAYGDGGFSMLVVLPEDPAGLAALEGWFDAATLARLVEGMRPQRVDVRLPSFTVTWGTTDLATALSGLGMGDLFRAGVADLSGIDGTRDLFVGGVYHQAFVAVDEEGTEAAAATAAVMLAASALPPPPTFRADRPFFFLIRAVATGDVVFMGRLVDPSER